MASISSETSYWIKFFTESGIPAGDAAHYAIVFSDNRIGKEMLLDLSKEYLTDMGITRLGDVIAILKHAKKVHNQDAKDLLLKSSSLSSRSSSPMVTPSSRRSTAASRMVNQITSKHPEASPMTDEPTPRPVSPDIVPKSKRKVSVFDRLGAESDDMTVNVPNTSSPTNSVFKRLGGKSAVKRPASSTSFLDESTDDSKDEGSLPYVGILKYTDTPPKKAKKVEVVPTFKVSSVNRKSLQRKKNFQIKKTIQTDDAEDTSMLSIQRPEVSTSTEGVLSAHAKKEAPSLRARLGMKSELPSSSTHFKMERLSKRKGKVNLETRSGAKKEAQSSSPVVSSSQQISSKLKKAKQISLRSAKQDNAQSSGVFSRLGKVSKS